MPISTAFRGQSRRTRVALAAIVLIFATIASWNIGDAGFSEFYSSAARSMSLSWRAFIFGTFDPGATITLDKLSGFVVPQAVSARIFGFHAWSIALPEVLEGMVTLVASYVVACRWRGALAGILAALITASTPLLPSMFGHVMEDGLLTMSLALALVFWQSSALTGRLLPLVFSGIWIGVGFQAKMMQAWLIVPAIVIGILIANTSRIRSGVARALVFLLAAMVSSLSWMTVIQLIPSGSRPYIDGSTNNNMFSVVFGYNGFNRLIPGLVPGAAPDFVHRIFSHQPDAGGAPKLLAPAIVTQVGWLYPLAIAGLVMVVISIIGARKRSGNAALATGATIAVWLGIATALLSAADIPHNAYFAAISVPVAILAAFGLVELIRHYRSDRWWPRLALPVVLAIETAWTLTTLSLTHVSPPWLWPTLALLGGSAVLGLLMGTRVDFGVRVIRSAIAIGVVAALIAPGVWSGSTVDLSLDGSANDAFGGPRIMGSNGFFRSPGSLEQQSTFTQFAIRAPVWVAPDPEPTPDERDLVRYLHSQQRGKAGDPNHYLLATTSWSLAAPLILRFGVTVLPMGGFSGGLPTPSLRSFVSLVRAGRVRFALTSRIERGSQSAHPTEVQRISAWVAAHCSLVPLKRYSNRSADFSATTLWSCSPP